MSATQEPSRLRAFLDTLDRLPPLSGVVFRGCVDGAEFVRDGQAVVTRGLVSGSRDLDVATEGRTSAALYAILSRTGRDISAFSSRPTEREVVFSPGCLFFLAETVQVDDLPVRLVLELEVGDGPPRVPEELLPRFAEEMAALLRQWRPAQQPREQILGKFVGDID